MDYDKLKKYLIYFVNFGLFLALLIYSFKYGSFLWENLKNVNLFYFLIAVLIQFVILVIISFKWKVLLRKFNDKIDFKNLFLIYNASNIYKYVPPKGVNYLMRINFLKKENIQGKVTSVFAELYTELIVSVTAALVLISFFVSFSKIIILPVFLMFFLLVLGTIKPKIILFALNLFRLKFERLRKLVGYFSELTKSKYYYQGLFLAFFVGFLHGISFYFLNKAFGFSYVSLWIGLILFYSAHFLALISFAPAGIGVRDISLTGLLVLYGYTRPDALIVALMYRVIMFVVELVTGLYSLIKIRN